MRANVLIYTVGHSTRSIEEFLALLRSRDIRCLVDVRRYPGSRRHPHFSRDALSVSLAAAGMSYLHLPEHGGRRDPLPDSPNTGWKNAAFRGYADHMASEEFRSGLERLLEIAGGATTAVMCAEAVPWRCHRNLLSDALVARRVEVCHIFDVAADKEHALTPFAVVERGGVAYPASRQGRLLEDQDEP
ncbi:MAG: DUF488 domain-containing protein [Dehalococcoidia bacterium]